MTMFEALTSEITCTHYMKLAVLTMKYAIHSSPPPSLSWAVPVPSPPSPFTHPFPPHARRTLATVESCLLICNSNLIGPEAASLKQF